ncbi:hypothetical protein K469DRAFT_687878 [Zopfia rhizophila CBS 207.26]|uniref:Uncharacterized protein n=1 Tax=Zopfia rhizophila CBS 207.26 TaxID=1314779 RepID=A0A6A6E5U9_9PEZI|nr:hypothetical protein K469DRAFT_687878 [Zopfia rhizophila CBS 207.26]
MNAPEKRSYVEDVLIKYKKEKGSVEQGAYAPYNIKVLRNYTSDGWYTQQNVLRSGDGKSLSINEEPPENAAYVTGDEIDPIRAERFTIPGCVDKYDAAPLQIPTLNVSCVDEARSIPNTIFSSDKYKVYNTFYNTTWNNHNILQWNFDAFGNLVAEEPSTPRMKRGSGFFRKRDDSPEQHTNWQFQLDWPPNDTADETPCYIDCWQAFSALAATPTCDQKGNGKNLVFRAGQIHTECGIYGSTVKGIAIP